MIRERFADLADRIRNLIQSGQVRVSEHGYDERGEETVRRKKTKYIHEGRYVAEVDVEIIEDETDWSPYLTVKDSYRLDDVREALRQNDLESAARYGRIYEMHPVGRE